MQWLIILVAATVISFGFVVIFGPPYIPTLDDQVDAALDLLNLKPGQTMLELGSGDGKIILAAARRGWKVVGYELNPILVVFSLLRTWRYRKQVKIIWGNFWTREWPPAEGMFNFLLNRQTKKLDTKIKAYKSKPFRVASFAFKIPDKKPAREDRGVFLYIYR